MLSRLIAGLAFAALGASGQVGTAPAPCPDVTGTTSGYVIGPLDVLTVQVWDNEKLSRTYSVRPDGMFSMPLAGEIVAAGLTVAKLEQSITAKLSEFMINPIVTIEVPRVNSKNYYVEGEVMRPGQFPLIQNLTVFDALSAAGGFREFARKNKIYILRGSQPIRFNYDEVSRGKRMEQNIPLQNGDHIIVPDRN